MTCQQNCFALFFQLQQDGPDISRPLFIQTVKRLIQNQKFRIFHYCLCYPQSLPHTQGIFRHRLFQSGSSPTFCRHSRMPFPETLRFRSARISRFFLPVYSVRNPGVSMISTQTFGKIRISSYIFGPTQMLPDVTGRKPQIHFMSTVLPEPLFPTIPYTFPRFIVMVVSFRTISSPNLFVTRSITT